MGETLPVPKKKRGLKFWLTVALCVLVFTPLLAYAVAWGYVNLGYLKSTVESNLSKKFGTNAHVGEVRSGVFGGMELSGVSIDARDKSAPITLDSAKVEWDLKPLLSDGQLRSILLERPQIDLRYSPGTGWNHSPNFSSSTTGIQIGRFEFRNGSFALGLPGGNLKLENISGNFTNFEDRGASPFVLRGELNGHDALVIEGSGGPAPGEFSVHGRGSFILEQDAAPFAPGLKGRANIELSARREMHGGGDLLALNADVSVKDFSWGHLNLPLEKFSVEANAKMTMSEIEFNNLKIGAEQHGTLVTHGVHQVGSRGYLRLDDTSWALDFEKLDYAFSPRLLDGIGGLRGIVTMSNASIMLPLAPNAPAFALKGNLKSPRLIWTVPNFGDLPEAEVEAVIDWPALQRGTIKFGDIASTELQMADMSGKGPAGTNFKKLHFDLGRFYESALGRKLMLGSAEGFVHELPFALAGAIRGDALESKWVGSAYTVSKLDAQELRVVKWPLSQSVPAWKFSGPVKVELDYTDGSMSALTLGAQLGSPKQNIKLAVKSKSPRAGAGFVEIEKFKAPLNEVDRAFALLAGTGMELSGELEAEGIRFEPGTGGLTGRIHLGNAGLNLPMTERLRAIAAGTMRLFGKDPEVWPNSVVKLLDAVGLRDLNADISLRRGNGKFSVSGRTQPSAMSISFPVLPDFSPPKVPQIPALSFQINSSDVANGVAHDGFIEWLGGRLSCEATRSKEGQWEYKGALTGKPDGFEARYAGTYDDAANRSGPLKITVAKLDLNDLAPGDEKDPSSAWHGAIKDLKIELGGAQGLGSETRITGQFDDASISFSGNAFENVRGNLIVRINAAEAGTSVDVVCTLDSYVAKCYDGFVRIAPPASGRSTTLKLAYTSPKFGNAPVRLEKCEFDVGDLFKISMGGLLHYDPRGTFTGAELSEAMFHSANLKSFGEIFAGENVTLAGRALFRGAANWEPSGNYRVDGKLKLEHVSVRVENESEFDADNLNGEMAISLPEKREPDMSWGDFMEMLRKKLGSK